MTDDVVPVLSRLLLPTKAIVLGVDVDVGVGVGVAVLVAVAVTVGVEVGVGVKVAIGVAITVGVGVAVGVAEAIGVAVYVGVGVGVKVRLGQPDFFVGQPFQAKRTVDSKALAFDEVASKVRTMSVRSNSETSECTTQARDFDR